MSEKYKIDEDLRRGIRRAFVDMSNTLLEHLDSDNYVQISAAFNSMDFFMYVVRLHNESRKLTMNTGLFVSQFKDGKDAGWTVKNSKHPLFDKIDEDEDDDCEECPNRKEYLK